MAQQTTKKGVLSDEQQAEFLLTTLKDTLRFAGLANSGGVLATMTALGATAKNGEIQNILAIPLALFAAGIVFALLTSLRSVFLMTEKSTGKPPKVDWPFDRITLVLKKYEDVPMFGTIICFILGCIIGVIIIAFV